MNGSPPVLPPDVAPAADTAPTPRSTPLQAPRPTPHFGLRHRGRRKVLVALYTLEAHGLLDQGALEERLTGGRIAEEQGAEGASPAGGHEHASEAEEALLTRGLRFLASQPDASDLQLDAEESALIAGEESTPRPPPPGRAARQAEQTLAAKAFSGTLLRAVLTHRRRIDAHLQANMQDWRLERLAVLVRSILRLATAELLIVSEVPAAIVIDEAVTLAKAYADSESSRFVNAVLDKVARGERHLPIEPPTVRSQTSVQEASAARGSPADEG